VRVLTKEIYIKIMWQLTALIDTTIVMGHLIQI